MRRLTTPKWLVTHAFVVGAVVLFIVLGWWQLRRGESGNLRSYGYALEWPSFALLSIGFWLKIAHDELHPKTEADTGSRKQSSTDEKSAGSCPSTPPKRAAAAAVRSGEDAELDAYNRYLADRARQRQGR